MKRNFLFISILTFFAVNLQAIDYVAFAREGKVYSLIDESGNVLSKDAMTKVYEFFNGYATCVIDKKLHYIDQNGKAFTYSGEVDRLDAFCEGVGAFMTDKQWGFINDQGEVVIEPQFQDTKQFSDGICWVKKDDAWFQIDKNAKELYDQRFDKFHYFKEGFARVRVGDFWGYIDKQGNYLGDGCVYTDNNDFVNGVAWAKMGELWGILKSDGSWLVQPKYNKISDHFSEGYAFVKIGEFTGAIKADGTEIIPVIYKKISPFKEGYCGALQGETWKVFDFEGNLIAAALDKFKDFQEGMAVVLKGEEWGYLLPSGEIKLLGKYQSIKDFVNGFAHVKANDKWGYINTSLEEVIPTQYNSVKDFKTEWTIVKTESGKWIYIDQKGKQVIDKEFDRADLFVRNKQLDAEYSCGRDFFYNTSFSSLIKKTKVNFVKGDMVQTEIARVEYNDEWGFINKKGEFILEGLENAEEWINGYARFRKDGVWGVIDLHGNIAVKPQYNNLTEFYEYCPR